MTTLSRRVRWLAPPVTIALALGVVGAVATPASAAKTTYSSDTDIYLDETNNGQANPAAITINDSGAATPYPSQITVTHDARILDVDVTLFDVSHTYSDDVDILLVGPHGQQVTLMSDAGTNLDLTADDLTFDDGAAASLPDAAQINPGTYKPTNYETGDVYPAPAPASNDNVLLSTFNDTLAAGVWSLYVADDISIFSGDIAGGWELEFDYATTPQPSTISVSGLPAITDVNVGVKGITSALPDDINLMLVGPGGQQSYLLGDAGATDDVANVDVVFDDEAAGPMPDTGPFVSGAYQPFYHDDLQAFPPPAPIANGSTTLSVFDGISPNGEWRLYAQDDANTSSLTKLSGWSLDFTWSDTQVPTGSVTVSGGAASTTSKNVTLNLSANDPAPASGVTEMRFSNDGVTFSAYQPYAATASWTLTGADGTKTVFAQFRDGDGNQSAVATDAIKLDATGPKAKKLTPKKNAKGVKVTTQVKIKANESLKKSTVTKKNVFIKQKGVSGKVKAKVKYNAAKKLIVLTPVDDLEGGKTYKVTVKGVQDAFGHKWDEKPDKSGAQALKFSFTTA